MDELSQLDELIESDILEALGQEAPDNNEINIEDDSQEIIIENFDESIDVIKNNDELLLTENNNNNDDDIQMINTTFKSSDLASLLGQLLNNKTIEITIKIKD
jgi:hypothetical protein